MVNFRVVRDPVSLIPGGTTGRLLADTFECVTLEPPWLGNEKNVSSIPVGRYEVAMEYSNHFRKQMPHVQAVPGRTDIMFHALNFPNQTKGCIGTGTVVAPRIGGIGGAGAAFDGFLEWFLEASGAGRVFVEISVAGIEPG